jgi:hypothetical protein
LPELIPIALSLQLGGCEELYAFLVEFQKDDSEAIGINAWDLINQK